MTAGRIRIGTSGWNYPSGRGTWNGVFYPARRPRGFDELAYYAEHFDTVEVNSTFYGEPRDSVTRTWVERTPVGFEFSLKLYQKFTHQKMYAKVASASAHVAERLPDALLTPNQADIDRFRRGIDPIASSGRLGALLAQFPPSFKDTPASREYLAWLLRAFGDYPVAVELRHRSWSDSVADTLSLLNGSEAIAAARALSNRVQREAGAEPRARSPRYPQGSPCYAPCPSSILGPTEGRSKIRMRRGGVCEGATVGPPCSEW